MRSLAVIRPLHRRKTPLSADRKRGTRSSMLSRIRQHHYWTVLIAQVILLFLGALMRNHIVLILLFIGGMFGVYGSVISAIWEKRFPRLLALGTGIVAAASGLITTVPGIGEAGIRSCLFVCCLAYATFIGIAIVSIGRNVFVTDRVTANRIVGSICIYLLIGMGFAYLLAAAGLAIPQSFRMASDAPLVMRIGDFFYFSYSALTTQGFGDVLPTHPFTKMMVSLEGVVGSVYLAIMVARLVGMHITQGDHHHRKGA